MKKSFVLPVAVALALSAAAGAQPANIATRAAIQAEWADHDKDGNGTLTPLEFGEWVMAANGRNPSAQVGRTRTSKRAGLPAVKLLNATAAVFAKADANGDRSITPEELAAFLGSAGQG